MTGVDDLIAFVRAQLDDDERVAQSVLRYSQDGYARGDAYEAWTTERKVNNAVPPYFDDEVIRTDRSGLREYEIIRISHLSGQFDAEHVARFASPRRVLAEVEAKRRILDRYEDALARQQDPEYSQIAAHVQAEEYRDWIIPALAQPYAGRDGWRPEWGVSPQP